jgi:hypothetical protein
MQFHPRPKKILGENGYKGQKETGLEAYTFPFPVFSNLKVS